MDTLGSLRGVYSPTFWQLPLALLKLFMAKKLIHMTAALNLGSLWLQCPPQHRQEKATTLFVLIPQNNSHGGVLGVR